MNHNRLLTAIVENGITRELTSEVRAALASLIRERALMRGTFILSSGKEASYYLDLRKLTLSADAAALIAYLFLEKIEQDVTHVGGPVIGADPIVSSIVTLSRFVGRDISGFLVRKEPKKHGTQNWLEGPVVADARVCLVEDVVTTGGSLLSAADRVREAGLKPVQALCLVDREETDVASAFAERGIAYEPIFPVSELLAQE